jgi:hypothetical protein
MTLACKLGSYLFSRALFTHLKHFMTLILNRNSLVYLTQKLLIENQQEIHHSLSIQYRAIDVLIFCL